MKQSKLPALMAIALFITSVSCMAQATTRVIIENNNALYFKLFAQKDSAIVNLYTDDASLLVPNTAPICGRKALIKDFAETFAAGKIKGVKFKTSNVYGNGGEYITEEGTWQVFDIKGKQLDEGKYLKLWKKTSTGWKIFRDLFNSNH